MSGRSDLPDPMARAIDDRGDGTLFAPPRPIEIPARRGHAPMAATSIAAHRSRARSSDREKLLKLLINQPSTLDELAALLDVPANQISGRLTELRAAGQIERTQARRKTRSGCTAAVWIATGAGLNQETTR